MGDRAQLPGRVTRRGVRAGGVSPHRFRPALGEVFDPAPETRASVMLWLDLGEISPAHADLQVPFFEVPPSVDELCMLRLGDGRYRIERAPAFETLEECFQEIDAELEDPLLDRAEDLAEQFGLEAGGSVDLRVVDPSLDHRWRRPFALTLTPEVEWLKSHSRAYYGVEGPEWLYCGCFQSDYFFGRLFVFYDTSSGRLKQICECT